MSTSIFSPEALNKIVDETISQEPAGGATHIVVGTVDQHGAQVVASFKRTFNDSATWELQAAARHDWNGDNSVGAKVLLKW